VWGLYRVVFVVECSEGSEGETGYPVKLGDLFIFALRLLAAAIASTKDF
jgi:hypothetical protein